MKLSDPQTQSKNFSPAVLIQVYNHRIPIYNENETLGLVKSAGFKIFTHIVQNLKSLSAKTFLRRGKVTQVREALQQHFKDTTSDLWKEIDIYKDFDDGSFMDSVDEIDLNIPSNIAKPEDLTIIFNNRLARGQMMNLQGIWGTKVIDRDDLVLKIFENHAKTRESTLQIDRARIALELNIVKREYGLHIQERQGRGFMGKGLSGWEPQMRAFRRRTRKIDLELEKITNRRTIQRKSRKKFFNVGIIGYTNAGKSTLLNRLANLNLETADEEFTTVIPRTRKVTFPKFDQYGQWCGEDVFFTDSVGFISDMSDLLFEAFLSTLEELNFSNLLLILVDIAEPDFSRINLKLQTTFQIIQQIMVSNIPKLFVFNKIDQATPAQLEFRINAITQKFPNIDHVSISAKEKLGFTVLGKKILDCKQKSHFNTNKI